MPRASNQGKWPFAPLMNVHNKQLNISPDTQAINIRTPTGANLLRTSATCLCKTEWIESAVVPGLVSGLNRIERPQVVLLWRIVICKVLLRSLVAIVGLIGWRYVVPRLSLGEATIQHWWSKNLLWLSRARRVATRNKCDQECRK